MMLATSIPFINGGWIAARMVIPRSHHGYTHHVNAIRKFS